MRQLTNHVMSSCAKQSRPTFGLCIPQIRPSKELHCGSSSGFLKSGTCTNYVALASSESLCHLCKGLVPSTQDCEEVWDSSVVYDVPMAATLTLFTSLLYTWGLSKWILGKVTKINWGHEVTAGVAPSCWGQVQDCSLQWGPTFIAWELGCLSALPCLLWL